MRILTYHLIFLSAIVGLGLCSACKKQTDYSPNDGQVGYINFYNAADGLIQNGVISGFHRIYINDSISKDRIPEFQSSDSFRQYPQTPTGSSLISDGPTLPNDVTYTRVYWLPLSSENYHFLYTSISADGLIKKDIFRGAAAIKTDSFTLQYLIEDVKADTAYQVINVPVERNGTPGKVRIQILNMSPDLGPLQVYREDANGNMMSDGLPSSLASADYSNYVDIDTTGSYKDLGQLLLKFRRTGSSNVLFTTSFPAISKSFFSVVVQGFASKTNRRIKSIQSNSTGFVPVTVDPNLRVNVRRVY